MFLPAWRNNSGSFLWCVDMEKPHFSRSKSVFLTQSTRYYSELNFTKPEENKFLLTTRQVSAMKKNCLFVASTMFTTFSHTGFE